MMMHQAIKSDAIIPILIVFGGQYGGKCKMDSGFKTWMCLICGWVYDEEKGAPEDGLPAGMRWEDVPMNWTCPECGARKEDFELVEI